MKPMKIVTFVALGALIAGCATVTPKELINARTAYHQASMGPAAHLSPAELHKAHEALILAEKSFVNEPDSYKTKDLAYVAQRKAQLAEVSGLMAADKARQAQADAAYQKEQSDIIKQGKEELRDSEKQTAATEQALRDSEKQTDDALAELAKLAALKEEERGLVLTLSGSILFRSAESALLPSARVKLEQVADALRAIHNRRLIVEGHTDSQGSDAYNQSLSQRRADAVRSFVVQRGYPTDYIQARGMGENSPIADNASAEGRANNRRVEIVIEREAQTNVTSSR